MAEIELSAEGPHDLNEIKSQTDEFDNVAREMASAPKPENRTVEEAKAADITYLYLTFNREVPTANTTVPAPPAPRRDVPPHPDLTRYGNPVEWPHTRKNVILVLCCIATFLTAYTSGSYSPPQLLMQEDLGADSTTPVLAGITTFCMGFALAPMVLAPFSEINGRYPVFVAAGVIYVVFQAVCGLATNLAAMLIARFFTGVGGSVFSTMIGGVIADMYDKENRNTPMAAFSGSVLVGTGAGPLIGAIMTRRLASGHGLPAEWRWVFWHQVIMATVLMVFLVLLFKESRGSVLLSRKAHALNKWYDELEEAGYYGLWIDKDNSARVSREKGADEEKIETPGPTSELQRIRWIVKEDEERTSIGKMISVSVYRPFHLLITEPVVFFFSMWVAFAWAVLYLTFGSIPLVFQRQYAWNIEQAGYIFVSMMIGSVLATGIGLWQEHILHHPQWQIALSDSSAESTKSELNRRLAARFWDIMRRRFPPDVPESRLYFTCISSTLLPIGLYMFGFTARPDIHWIVPAISICLATMGIYSVYLAAFNYLADTYHKYASSALAAQSFCRNVLGGVFPLVTGPLFRNLGEANAGAVLGSIAAILTVVPWVLVFFGSRIRARSPFASELSKG
ncbi:MFS general substrate transporter [Thozetella sp. PMI_491]|nr:MFS general substrate transporter [Thozetella sp. PMI_491]